MKTYKIIYGRDEVKKIKFGRWILLLIIIAMIIIVFWKFGIRREKVLVVTNEIEMKDAYKSDYHLASTFFMMTDGKTVEKMTYSGKQIWKADRMHKNIVFGEEAYYEYNSKGIIEKHELDSGEITWSTDFNALVQYVKEDDGKLYIIIQKGQMSSIGLVVDSESGTPKFDKQFNEEQIVKMGNFGNKNYALTLRLGKENLYSNLYIMDANGEIEYQKSYEREILTKLEKIDRDGFLLYSDEYLRYMSENEEIWRYPLIEDTIDYTFDKNEMESVFIKKANGKNTNVEKVSLSEQIVTELGVEDELNELITLEDGLIYCGEKGLYFIDGMNQILRLYDFDSRVYKTEDNYSNVLLVFKDRLQLIKESYKWTGGNENDN